MPYSQRRLPSLFGFPLIVMDFEASALSLQSYPIEVGIAIARPDQADIETWSTLIVPDADWDMASQWDPDAELVHKISKWQLRDGLAAHTVMMELNRRLAGAEVWCDGGQYDGNWLRALSAAANVTLNFRLANLHLALRTDPEIHERYVQALAASYVPHRAGPDTTRICEALRGSIA